MRSPDRPRTLADKASECNRKNGAKNPATKTDLKGLSKDNGAIPGAHPHPIALLETKAAASTRVWEVRTKQSVQTSSEGFKSKMTFIFNSNVLPRSRVAEPVQ